MALQADAQTVTLRIDSHEFQPLVQYQKDFDGFCRDILGIHLWAKQIEIGNSVRDNPRTVVSACYASGKTFTAACLVLWWLFTRRPAMCVTTAPTGRQVRTLLWREIKKLHRKAKIKLPGRPLQTRLEIAEDWLAFGFASDSANSVAGLHEGNVLFIEDEAAGMETHIVEGFEGITAGSDSRHLKIGNPICESGPFYDALVNPLESQRWHPIYIDAEETPNVVERRKVVPGLVEWDWVEDKRHRWLARGLMGLWETRVKGKIYVSASQKVVPGDWITQAGARWEDADTYGERVLGVDIGAGGTDPTVVYFRQGERIDFLDSWQLEDLWKQAERIANLATENRVQRIVVDRTGVGQGVWSDLLKLQDMGQVEDACEIIGVALNKSANDKETFQDAASELAFYLRDALDPAQGKRYAINPNNKQLAEELGYRTWSKNEKGGRIEVISKKAMRKSGLGSPDHADAAALCCAPGCSLAVL